MSDHFIEEIDETDSIEVEERDNPLVTTIGPGGYVY